ncbi:sensor histidine kinase [Streptomyces sp. TS71-3]|uniref:sensor histidine kinase n=1 Tax=Streptomyces sp. TS71-3 TaxID=2733862 RepID=UPI001B2073A0|nr:histidine kinase [Streptomyces sp. TS71-3]GHJ40033.1 two-component sensor histidine kinase [Streptomyces sp. TS71-3]
MSESHAPHPADPTRPDPRRTPHGEAGAGAPPGSRLPHTPEYRFAVQALRGLRQDLVEDAGAYRPLPPAKGGRRRMRWLPGRLRSRMVWARHAVVVAAALIVLLIGYATGTTPYGGADALGVLDGLVPMAAVLLTLIRPVAAFWVSLASSPVLCVLVTGWGGASDAPWLPGGFAGHLVVLTVVALRTGPRAAGWMWALTAVYGVLGSVVLDQGMGSDAPAMLVVSAVVLLCVAVRHIRRAAQQEVTAERHVSAAERSRRTLLEERTTIARELHDVVAHHMSVVAIQAEAAPYRVENPPPELTQAFSTIRENAVAALTELRRLLGVVRAEDYQAPDAPQPTLADLDTLLANVREAGLDVTKTVTGAVRELPPGVELSAYRFVQEALSNVLRHAPGARASVEIGHVLGGLGLRIVNGPATEPAKPSHGAGHGVTGMRERVTMLGGEMTAGPTADGGYEVAAFLPVEPVHEAGGAPVAATGSGAGMGTATGMGTGKSVGLVKDAGATKDLGTVRRPGPGPGTGTGAEGEPA